MLNIAGKKLKTTTASIQNKKTPRVRKTKNVCLDSHIKFKNGRLVTEINILHQGESSKGCNLGHEICR